MKNKFAQGKLSVHEEPKLQFTIHKTGLVETLSPFLYISSSLKKVLQHPHDANPLYCACTSIQIQAVVPRPQ